MTVRVGLNLLHARPEIGGGWNYIGGLVDAVARFGQGTSLVAFVQRESAVLVPANAGVEVVQCDVDAASRPHRVAFEHFRLPGLVRRMRLDCVHHFAGTMPMLHRGRAVVTMYDLLVYHRPATFSLGKRIYLRRMVAWTVGHADVLLPMSAATAADVADRFGVPGDRILVIPTVVDERFRAPDPRDLAAFRARHGLAGAYWLYVAHGYEHKNHMRLLAAYAGRLRRGTAAWPLVLRGEHLEAAEARARELGVADRVTFLGRLAPPEMPRLYAAAGALVFPSLFEGGGIPVLEAMACGCPVTGARIAATLEAAGPAATTFDPEDVTSIEAAMDEMEGSAGLRDRCRQEGLRRLERHRPEAIAALCREAYRRAVRAPRHPGWP
jgi:glycosyltransferase involved in cell wall biosynthesis